MDESFGVGVEDSLVAESEFGALELGGVVDRNGVLAGQAHELDDL